MRGHTPDGRKVTLKSLQLSLLGPPGLTITGGTSALPPPNALDLQRGKIAAFDYWTEGIHEEVGQGGSVTFHVPDRLNITVIDADGQRLGTEEITLRLEVRHHRAVEGL